MYNLLTAWQFNSDRQCSIDLFTQIIFAVVNRRTAQRQAHNAECCCILSVFLGLNFHFPAITHFNNKPVMSQNKVWQMLV